MLKIMCALHRNGQLSEAIRAYNDRVALGLVTNPVEEIPLHPQSSGVGFVQLGLIR